MALRSVREPGFRLREEVVGPAMCLAVALTERVVSMGQVGGRVAGLLAGRVACVTSRFLHRRRFGSPAPALPRDCRRAFLPLLGLLLLNCSPVLGQFQSSTRFELSDTVYVDEPESAARSHLEQVKAYLQNKQWDEAIEVLRGVADKYGDKLVKRPPVDTPLRNLLPITQYSNVRDYCQWQIAGLPAEALASYRQRVDDQAEQPYREAVAARDPAALEQVVRQFFSSSWGDDALLAWGDLALEGGDYFAARAAWQQILREPATEQAAGQPPVRRMVFPDSTIPPADIGARLILASILERDTQRAQAELSEFTRLYPTSTGRLGGREVAYAGVLTSLLASSREWTASQGGNSWSTFAGSPARSRIVQADVDVGAIAWRLPLKKLADDEVASLDMSFRLRGVADDRPRRPRWLLSYHPVIYENLLLVNDADEIKGVDLLTGKPAWGGESPVIYREEQDPFISQQGRLSALGVPRFTMTVHDGRLYARMGSPVTIYGNEMQRRGGPGFLVCLDLRAQGKLIWKLLPQFTPDDGKWAFEGSPICDGENLYVAIRHSDVRPQAHLACYEAKSGKLRWTRFLCAAETPGSGQKDESTSNLLTLDEHRLYVNTNLGAVAAVDTRDGRIEWLTVYRTPQEGDWGDPSHFRRDLNPVVAYRGKLFVAPSDSETILALDAATGDLLWESPHASDAVELLGVGGGNLIASGDRLYWINSNSGKLVHRWPDGSAPKGYGRGALVGNQVLWSTREDLYLLSQQSGQIDKIIQLASRQPSQTGGNILIGSKHLYVAGSDNITCYSQYSPLPAASDANVGAKANPPGEGTTQPAAASPAETNNPSTRPNP